MALGSGLSFLAFAVVELCCSPDAAPLHDWVAFVRVPTAE
jgi:hypothetical protein